MVVKDVQSVNDLFRQQKMCATINIPNQGRNKDKFSFHIRVEAARYNVKTFTRLDTVKAILDMKIHSSTDKGVRTISEFYKLNKRGVKTC